jgi:hypothetical protein
VFIVASIWIKDITLLKKNNIYDRLEKFEDANKGVIKSRNSKDRQYKDQIKYDKQKKQWWTKHYTNVHRKSKKWTTRIPLKPVTNSGASERLVYPAQLMAPVVS